MTTTGQPCYWKRASNIRDPGLAATKDYSQQRRIDRRNTFDFRATRFQTEGPLGQARLKTFHGALREHLPQSLLMYHLGPLFDDPESPTEVSENMQLAAENAVRRMLAMKAQCEGKTEPFELPGTRGQDTSQRWAQERASRSTASDSKTFLGLTSDRAKRNYLRRKVWQLDAFESEAMRLGKQYEDGARRKYAEFLRSVGDDAEIQLRGTMVNPKYPQLACSPDGIISIPSYLESDILFEAKFLTKDHVNPDKFEEGMTPKESQRFYLRRNSEGVLYLKETHAYYYQIQMSLDILELEWCHLMVYSAAGYTIVPVQRDPNFWHEKRLRLIKRHRQMLLPEFTLRRTLRYLPPLVLEYNVPTMNPEAMGDLPTQDHEE